MSPVARPFVGVVADDITGAGDIGGLFAKHGYAVRVFTAETKLEALPARLRDARTDVVVVDTDSRLESPEVGAERVRRATRALLRAGCETFWKKTCSVFRGNVGQEFDAMLDALGEDFGVVVAAFPKNGRTTVHGLHYVRGVPLHESEFRHDPVHPRINPNLLETFGAQTRRRVVSVPLEAVRQGADRLRDELGRVRAGGGYALVDAQTQDDLAVIARASAGERVLLGSSALAEELPLVWTPAPPFDGLEGVSLGSGAGVLAVAGSVMPQTRAQLEHFAAYGGAVLTLPGRAALETPDRAVAELADAACARLEAGQDVAVRSENTPQAIEATRALGARLGLDAVAVSKTISGSLARVARIALERASGSRLVALGGDTSAAVCRELGVTETVVLWEIAPGLPISLAPRTTRRERPLLLALKSGSFGGTEFLPEAFARLRDVGGPR